MEKGCTKKTKIQHLGRIENAWQNETLKHINRNWAQNTMKDIMFPLEWSTNSEDKDECTNR